MKQQIKNELMYLLYSKIYIILLLLLCGIFFAILFMNYNSVFDSYDSYVRTKQYYQENNLDIEEDLSGTYTYEKVGDTVNVSNPILYYKECVGRFLYAASPEYTTSQMLESSILFFPLLFGILGLVVSNNDYKYKTIKLKSVMVSKRDFGIFKQLSIIISSFSILAAALLIAKIAGYLEYSIVCTKLPVSDFYLGGMLPRSTVFTKVMFGYGIALLYAEIGYTLGIVFKNTLVGAAAIAAYTLAVPNLGKFDLKNSLYYFAHNVFDFYGVISLEASKETSLFAAISVVVILFILFITVNMAVITRRSSYDC